MKKFGKLFIAFVMLLSIISCSKTKEEKTQKWEYKIVCATSFDSSNFTSKSFNLSQNEEQLNKLGDEGWELVDVYTRIETVYPNFGDEKYHTGIKSNTRTQAVFFVFKRPKKEVDKMNKQAADSTAIEDSVPIESAAVAEPAL